MSPLPQPSVGLKVPRALTARSRDIPRRVLALPDLDYVAAHARPPPQEIDVVLVLLADKEISGSCTGFGAVSMGIGMRRRLSLLSHLGFTFPSKLLAMSLSVF